MLGRVLLIAPYKGLATLAGRMARRRRDLDITVRTADLEQAIPLLDWAHGKGFDLIISRGGTALMLEKRGSLPVIEIAVSGYDLFRLTSFIKDYSSRVTLIGFPNVCAGVATFSDYLNVDIPYTVVHRPEDVDAAILRARDDGCVVIGDTVTVRKAEEIGVKGILISSGPESINLSFELAANLLRGMRRMRDRQKAVEHSLNSLGRGVALCTAEGGRVTLMPSVPLLPHRQRWRDQLVPFFAAHHSMPEGPYLLKKGPMSSDAPPEAVLAPVVDERRFLLFHAADVVGDRPVRQVLVDSPPVTLHQLIADQYHLERPARRARTLLDSVGVIALVGEPGTGRTRMLRAIQTTLYGADTRLLAGVDIRHGVREALRLVLDTLDSSTGTLVHLSGVERLKRVDQEQLARELSTYGHGVVLLFPDSPDRLAKHGGLSQAMADLVKDRHVMLPGVVDDPVILESSVLYNLMEANVAHGKNVRGVTPTVLDALRARSWPNNFEDLSRFVDRLVREMPDGDQMITDLPANDGGPVSNRNGTGFSVDLSRPLEEIEARVIEAVLAEEHGNQSAAAARLGIGRTTLWRKLQRTR